MFSIILPYGNEKPIGFSEKFSLIEWADKKNEGFPPLEESLHLSLSLQVHIPMLAVERARRREI